MTRCDPRPLSQERRGPWNNCITEQLVVRNVRVTSAAHYSHAPLLARSMLPEPVGNYQPSIRIHDHPVRLVPSVPLSRVAGAWFDCAVHPSSPHATRLPHRRRSPRRGRRRLSRNRSNRPPLPVESLLDGGLESPWRPGYECRPRTTRRRPPNARESTSATEIRPVTERRPLTETHPHLKDFLPFLDDLNKETARGAVLVAAAYLERQLGEIVASFVVEGRPAKSRSRTPPKGTCPFRPR